MEFIWKNTTTLSSNENGSPRKTTIFGINVTQLHQLNYITEVLKWQFL